MVEAYDYLLTVVGRIILQVGGQWALHWWKFRPLHDNMRLIHHERGDNGRTVALRVGLNLTASCMTNLNNGISDSVGDGASTESRVRA